MEGGEADDMIFRFFKEPHIRKLRITKKGFEPKGYITLENGFITAGMGKFKDYAGTLLRFERFDTPLDALKKATSVEVLLLGNPFEVCYDFGDEYVLHAKDVKYDWRGKTAVLIVIPDVDGAKKGSYQKEIEKIFNAKELDELKEENKRLKHSLELAQKRIKQLERKVAPLEGRLALYRSLLDEFFLYHTKLIEAMGGPKLEGWDRLKVAAKALFKGEAPEPEHIEKAREEIKKAEKVVEEGGG